MRSGLPSSRSGQTCLQPGRIEDLEIAKKASESPLREAAAWRGGLSKGLAAFLDRRGQLLKVGFAFGGGGDPFKLIQAGFVLEPVDDLGVGLLDDALHLAGVVVGVTKVEPVDRVVP